MSIGSVSETIVHPREVLKAAILSNAASIIVAHNHPSGNSKPSLEDKNITTRLVRSDEILGIGVLDHLIIGDGQYFSFSDSGILCRPHRTSHI